MIFGEQLEASFYKAIHVIMRSKVIDDLSLRAIPFFFVLAFVDDLNEYSFSFGMYLPPMVRVDSFLPENFRVSLLFAYIQGEARKESGFSDCRMKHRAVVMKCQWCVACCSGIR